MIDSSGAFLNARAEFVVENDITALNDSLLARFERRAACNQETLALDRQWQESGASELIAPVAEAFGERYIKSTSISPGWERSRQVPLPLRIGSRVREVFIASDGQGPVEAIRGQLLMHRTEGQESGFFVLLTKRKDDPVPKLSFGNLAVNVPGAEAYQVLAVETILGGKKAGFFDDYLATNPAAVRAGLAAYNPQQQLEGLQRGARDITQEGETWESKFIEMYGSRPDERDKIQSLFDALLSEQIEGRRLRRDIVRHGFLRQHESAFVPGQSLHEVAAGLQSFFDEVAQPIETLPEQKRLAIAELRDGLALASVDGTQISELDVARSIIHRHKRERQQTPPEILPLPEISGIYAIGEALGRRYDRYPELKEYIQYYTNMKSAAALENDCPGITELVKANPDNPAIVFEEYPRLSRMSFWFMGPFLGEIYRGECHGNFLGGLSYGEFDQLIDQLKGIEVAPSPKAFPYD